MAELQQSKSDEASVNSGWDNALLIKAYDTSIKLANEELARRIAISTNSHQQRQQNAEGTESHEQPLPSGSEEAPDSSMAVRSSSATIEYKVGDFARATYVADGNDYEGQIISVDAEGETCLIRFIGYENEQHVLLTELVPSWGKKARRKQSCLAKKDEEPQSESGNETKQKKKSKSSRSHASRSERIDGVPPPPPMPPMLLGQDDGSEEHKHLSAMLMSWYMSGYYTGVYQGMQQYRTKKNVPSKK